MDKEIKIRIDADGNADEEVKKTTDESERLQRVLREMSEKDDITAQDERWKKLNATAQEYAKKAQAAADADKARAEDAQGLEGFWKAFTTTQGQASEATQKHEGTSRALYSIFHELNKIVPELGQTLHAVFLGELGAVLGFGMAVEECYAKLKDFNDELDRTAERNAQPDFLTNITAQTAALATAAAAAQSYADSLAHAADVNNSINTKLQEQLGLYNAIERAQARQTSAEKELEIAKVQTDEASGNITPEQAAQKRADIEKKYLVKTQQDHEDAQNAEMAAKEKALHEAEDKRKQLAQTTNAARAQVDKDTQHTEAVKIDPNAQLDAIKKQIQAISDAQEKLDMFKSGGKGDTFYGSVENQARFTAAGGIGMRPANIDAAQRDLDLKQAQLAQMEHQRQQFEADRNNAPEKEAHQDALTDAQKKEAENKKEIEDLKKQISAEKELIAKTRGTERQTADTQQQTVDEKEKARIAQDFEKDFRALDEFARSKSPSRELIQKVIKAITDIAAMMKDHTDLLKTLPDYDAAMADLARDIAAIKSTQATTRNTGTSG